MIQTSWTSRNARWTLRMPLVKHTAIALAAFGRSTDPSRRDSAHGSGNGAAARDFESQRWMIWRDSGGDSRSQDRHSGGMAPGIKAHQRLCLTVALSAPHSPRTTLALSISFPHTSFTRLSSLIPRQKLLERTPFRLLLYNTLIWPSHSGTNPVNPSTMASLRPPRVLVSAGPTSSEAELTLQSFKIGQRHVTVPTIPAIIAGVVTLLLVYTLSTPSRGSSGSVDTFTPHLATPEEIPATYYSTPGMSYLELTSNPLFGLQRTKSKFLVKPEQFPPTPLKKHLPDDFKVPDYVPKPVGVKVPGMRVPNAIHYVYGLKPPKQGYSGEQLPYYAYLAMKSAITRLKPEKTFL